MGYEGQETGGDDKEKKPGEKGRRVLRFNLHRNVLQSLPAPHPPEPYIQGLHTPVPLGSQRGSKGGKKEGTECSW